MNYINNFIFLKNKRDEYAGQVRKNSLKDLFSAIKNSSTATTVSIQFNDFLNSFYHVAGKVKSVGLRTLKSLRGYFTRIFEYSDSDKDTSFIARNFLIFDFAASVVELVVRKVIF